MQASRGITNLNGDSYRNSIYSTGEGSLLILRKEGKAANWQVQPGINFNQKAVSDEVQTLPVMATQKRISGNHEVKVGDVHFVNQDYSTYSNFSYNADLLTENDLSRYASYIALPTSTKSNYLQGATTATYQGKALKDNYDNNQIAQGDFRLEANFQTEKVQGAISNLGGRNYELAEGNISVSDDGKLTFSGSSNYNGSQAYQGIFAGPNAEEVVGRVGYDISFGGKREATTQPSNQ